MGFKDTRLRETRNRQTNFGYGATCASGIISPKNGVNRESRSAKSPGLDLRNEARKKTVYSRTSLEEIGKWYYRMARQLMLHVKSVWSVTNMIGDV